MAALAVCVTRFTEAVAKIGTRAESTDADSDEIKLQKLHLCSERSLMAIYLETTMKQAYDEKLAETQVRIVAARLADARKSAHSIKTDDEQTEFGARLKRLKSWLEKDELAARKIKALGATALREWAPRLAQSTKTITDSLTRLDELESGESVVDTMISQS